MPDGEMYQMIVTKMFLLLIVAAILYYMICECLIGGSIGKRICFLKLVNEENMKVTGKSDALVRAIMRALIGIFFMFHKAMGISVFSTLLLYMLITKCTVPFKQKSFVDLFTGTMYVNTGEWRNKHP